MLKRLHELKDSSNEMKKVSERPFANIGQEENENRGSATKRQKLNPLENEDLIKTNAGTQDKSVDKDLDGGRAELEPPTESTVDKKVELVAAKGSTNTRNASS